ncbi:MAG: hypothetical protein JSW54_02255 [Fidelibacterota bacterium]|nr:MAG: hypothetical protein JSW54_02255 [Candidatus Neomarinimicrobiota bacterium]
MASFFDSPLFWIIVIWWLLSTFLGAKARKRRAAQAAAEPELTRSGETPQPEAESELLDSRKRPARLEIDTTDMEQPPRGIPYPPNDRGVTPEILPRKTSRPAPTSKVKSPLEEIFRGLGLTQEMIPPQFRPEREAEPPIELAPTPVTELEAVPEVDEKEEVRQELMEGAPPPSKAEYAAPRIHAGYSLLSGALTTQLTSLQQAVVLKEILDRPRALRRGVR